MDRFAWMMEAPRVFGELHIFLAILYIGLAVICTRMALRLNHEARIRLLTFIGWLLIAAEIFKQLFVYYVVNGGAYDYWYIPFQLCSVPMYMCALLPVLKGKARDAVLTFMCGYTFISAVATFIYPEDILRPYVILTMHGFDWHAVLLVISLTIGLSGMADLSFRGFIRATYLFLSLCAVAVLINIATETLPPLCTCGHGYANMFYLSPFHPSRQPIVSSAEEGLGRIPAMLLYTASVIGAAGAADYFFHSLNKRK